MRKQQQELEGFVNRIKEKKQQLKVGHYLESSRNLGSLTQQPSTEAKRTKYKKQHTSIDLVSASQSRKKQMMHLNTNIDLRIDKFDDYFKNVDLEMKEKLSEEDTFSDDESTHSLHVATKSKSSKIKTKKQSSTFNSQFKLSASPLKGFIQNTGDFSIKSRRNSQLSQKSIKVKIDEMITTIDN